MSREFPENLSDCASDPERAEWLIRASYGWLGMYGGSILADIDKAGFEAGKAYYQQKRMMAFAVLLPDGSWPQTMQMRLHYLKGVMLDDVRKGRGQ